jgi:hypothetical protein
VGAPTAAGTSYRARGILGGRYSGAAAAFTLYALLAFLYFGLRPLLQGGRQYIGVFDDPQIPIWSFGWWLRAIEHGTNPLVTHLIWAPSGVDLVWVNTVPALSLVFAPLTALLGPAASYDVAAVLLPAVSAWSGFLLCRHLTARFWPSLVGGYLFGFSAYEIGHVLGQPQLTAVFVVPLVALVLVRRIVEGLSTRRFVVELGLLLALQVYLATEITFTLTIVLLLALVVAFLVAPERRRAITGSLLPLASAYLLAGVLAAPVLYYALTDLRVAGFQPPEAYTADLLNLVIPSHLEAFGAGWAHSIARHFPGNSTEQGALIGIPLLVIVALYAQARWRTSAGRFLLGVLVLAVFLSFGPWLTVAGHKTIPLPTVLGRNSLSLPGLGRHYLPLFDNILPVRFALYTSLAGAAIAAVWMASTRSRVLRVLLPALAVLVLVPNPGAGIWTTDFSVPAFFTASAFRSCLAPNEIVLPEPIGQGGQATLWQAESGFHLRLAGGRLQTSPPTEFLHPSTIAQIGVGYAPVANQASLLRRFFAEKGVTAAIVDPRDAATWTPALDKIAKPRRVGGVIFYRVSGKSPAC